MDALMQEMEVFKKQTGLQTLHYTNQIAEEQQQLQEIEADKARLMIGNEEKTEMRLKETNEHGIILMSIKNLFEKIGVKNEQNGHDCSLVQHKNLAAALGEDSQDRGQAKTQKYSENECLLQLDVVKAYI